MKHGDKAKAKTAKASSKASVKKAASKSGTPQKSKADKAAKGGKDVKTVKTVETGKAAARETVAKTKGVAGNGRSSADAAGFSNAAIAAAFRRAVKKYPNAFRRLTD